MGYTLKQRKNRKYVFSRIIYFIEYDQDTSLLKIGFNDGLIGYFEDVPGDLIDAFQHAPSIGNFYYQNVHRAGFRHWFKQV
jgi:hypothetical protein